MNYWLLFMFIMTSAQTWPMSQKTLYDAAQDNDLSLATWLLNSGDYFPIPSVKFDAAPLMFAAKAGHIEMINLLIDAGADLETRDRRGWTALTYACYHNHPDCVTELLRRGADPYTECNAHWTPLLYATLMGATACVRQLFCYSTDHSRLRQAKVWGRDTALDIAHRWLETHERQKIKLMMTDQETFTNEMHAAAQQERAHQLARLPGKGNLVSRLRNREIGR